MVAPMRIRPGRGRPAFRTAAGTAMVVLVLHAFGCARDEPGPTTGEKLLQMKGEALELYVTLHPLRSSRLGFPGADSLLFTFSPDEVSHSLSKLDSIHDRLSSLPASDIGEREREDSDLLIRWLRGERFALSDLASHRNNPLLYCWMVEEAIYGAPFRPGDPLRGESEAYSKRISRIPALLENASQNLEKTAEIHLGAAIARTRALLSDFGGIEEAALKKYGTLPPGLDRARKAIDGFERFLGYRMESESYGRMILGVENLTDILLFSEKIDIDFNSFTDEAEKELKRLRSHLGAIASSPAPADTSSPGGGITPDRYRDAGEMLEDIEKMTSEGSPFPGAGGVEATIFRAPIPPIPEELPVNPYLVVPSGRYGGFVSFVSGYFSKERCAASLLIPRGIERTDRHRMYYDLMGVSSAVTLPRRQLCREKDIFRAVFSSRTYELGWRCMILKEFTSRPSEGNIELRRIYMEEKMRDIARMIVVFRLHSGKYTVESAADFLTDAIAVSRGEAMEEIAAASALPSVSLPGISALQIDMMTREISQRRGVTDPGRRLRTALYGNRSLPLAVITRKDRD